MKAPQPETLDEAIRLASFIRRVEGNGDETMWSAGYAHIAWGAGSFQRMVNNDWEHVWSEDQCRRIMADWVAYRISR